MNNNQLNKEINKVISELIAEGLFDRLKAKASGTAGQIGQYGKNLAAFVKGDKKAITDPNLVKGINTLRSRITGVNKSLQSTSEDLLALFPDPSQLPGDLQKIVGDYAKQMQDILNYHTKLLKALNTSGQAGANAAKKVQGISTTTPTKPAAKKPATKPTTTSAAKKPAAKPAATPAATSAAKKPAPTKRKPSVKGTK